MYVSVLHCRGCVVNTQTRPVVYVLLARGRGARAAAASLARQPLLKSHRLPPYPVLTQSYPVLTQSYPVLTQFYTIILPSFIVVNRSLE